MQLNDIGLKDKNWWEKHGYQVPKYDRASLREQTLQEPTWIHFGAGNIFRAFLANVAEGLLNRGEMNRGIIVAEGFDYEILEKSSFFGVAHGDGAHGCRPAASHACYAEGDEGEERQQA